MNYGHAVNQPRSIDFDHFKLWLDRIYSQGKVAFGANFYNFIRKHAKQFDVSLYPPEIMSGDQVLIRLYNAARSQMKHFDKVVIRTPNQLMFVCESDSQFSVIIDKGADGWVQARYDPEDFAINVKNKIASKDSLSYFTKFI